MDALQDIIERTKRLTPSEPRKLADVIDQRLPEAVEKVETLTQEARRLAALDAFIAMAGTGHSDFTDVARNKYKHLGEVYADKHVPADKK